MPSIYNLQQEHLSLIAQIEESDGEMAPHVEHALGLTADAMQQKAVAVAFVVKHFEDEQEAISREIARLKLREAASVKRSEWLRERLSEAMKQFGIEKIDSPTMRLSFRKSNAVEVTNVSVLPDEFITSKTTVSADKAAIKAALERGEDVAGAELVTRQNLQIK